MRLTYAKPLASVSPRRFSERIRSMRNVSGVYVIRRVYDRRVEYVGESHTGRLYDTLTRHFRSWSGPTAGYTASPEGVEVAVLQVPSNRAVAAQNALIRRLRPRWNTQGRFEDESPF